MITLTVILAIWCFVAYKRLEALAKKKGEFNPFNGTFFDYFGFIFGCGWLVGGFIYLVAKYLP